MLLRPFKDKSESPPWQVTFENRKGTNVDKNFIFAINRMEMWRSMILPKHLNDNAVEDRNRRHCLIMHLS